jgi:hypothetical protein
MKTPWLLLPLTALLTFPLASAAADSSQPANRTASSAAPITPVVVHRAAPEAVALGQLAAGDVAAARTTALAAFVRWTDEDDGAVDDFRWRDLASALARCGLPEEALKAAHRIQRPGLRALAEAEASAPPALAGS